MLANQHEHTSLRCDPQDRLEHRIQYDLYYIENWSLALDLKILWLTITNGLGHEHAY